MILKHCFASLLAFLLTFITCLSSTAQTPITVKGNVTDENTLPIQGVTVNLKGTNQSVTSNEDGDYSIKVPDGKGTLVFTSVNFGKREISVNSRKELNVTMTASNRSLNEVVVVGYGTQKKREVTSSVSTMKGEEIEKYNVNSFQSALQGQMAGVEMYESSGVPGAAVNVRIRGVNTVNGSAGPLYVVDGIPIFSGGGGDGDSPQGNGPDMGSQTNVMNDINPNDIESIEVLKDAAASAIYGARGSGGVILITTKRGKTGKTSFNLNLINGFTEITKSKELLQGPQLLSILDESYRNSFYSIPGNATLPLPASPLPAIANFTRGMADTTNINHLNNVIRRGVFREATFSAMNGTDKTKFYVSGTYKQSVATIQGTSMEQFNFKLNLDHQLSRIIKLGISVTPSYNIENRLGSGTTINLGGYGAALTTNLPIYPLYNADGTYFNPWTNPEAFKNRDLFSGKNRRTRIIGSAYMEIDLAKGLRFRTLVQREDWSQVAPTFTSGLLRVKSNGDASPFADDRLTRILHQNSYGYLNSIESYFTYTKNIAKNHHVNSVLGMRYSDNDGFYEAIYGENFANSNLIYASQAAFVEQGFQTGAQGDPNANLGYFFRTQYDFKKKYLLSVVVNRDGSSRFGTERRFGTFPAFSAGWIISDENFMKNSRVLTFLKIRGSFGFTGNSAGIGNNAAKNTWQGSTAGYMGNAANIPQQAANADLRWEKGTKSDAGIDLEFLNGRISTTIDVYKNKTTDMLLSIPVPVTYGFGNSSSDLVYLENRGALYNKGIEFSVTGNILTGSFKWRSTFNISHNETRILSLGGLDPNTVSGGAGDVQLYVGKNAPVYYLIESMGIDPATGDELINDADGKIVRANSLNATQLNDARKPQFDKSPAPKFYGGFGNNFSYKDFTLSVFFSYRVGNYLLDAGERISSYVGNISVTNEGTTPNIFLGNLPVSILNRWQKPGDITDVPRLYYNDAANSVLRGRNTTRFLSDASYVRLKNLQFGYNVPTKVLQKFKLKTFRINLTGQNLFMLTKFDGTDPEAVNIQTNYRERNVAYGIIRNVVPQSRTFTLGLNVGF